MRIKEAVQENCGECGRFKREISPEQYGCDECKTPIAPFGNDEQLDVTVFYKSDSAEHFYFCSWKCVFEFTRHIATDYFFKLPYVSHDNAMPGRRAKDFFAAIKNVS